MKDKPAIISQLEKSCAVTLTRLPEATQWATPLSYAVNEKGRVITLNLNGAGLKELVITDALQHLQKLDISRNKLINVRFDTDLPELELLDISYNTVALQPIHFSHSFAKLKYLYIYNSGLTGVRFTKGLPSLDTLHLANNKLTGIKLPDGFDSLLTLYLQNNKIGQITQEPELSTLLGFLKKEDRMLQINDNPFLHESDLELVEEENHSAALLNFLLPYKTDTAVELILPAKVLLLGNHASGKSSLLYYLQHQKLAEDSVTTHIINIDKYPLVTDTGELPQAIFYDFGGQDYYHGLYRVFLSQGAVQVLLWNNETNRNKVLDKDANKIATIHYNLDYWLAQNQYTEKGKYGNTERQTQNPMLLVQRDSDSRLLNAPLPPAQKQANNIQAEFLLTLKKSREEAGSAIEKELLTKTRELFLAHLTVLITDNQKHVKREPWYEQFLTYILDDKKNTGYAAITITALETKLRKELGRKDTGDDLPTHLDQLHRQGLVLYYKNEMPERVWLSPKQLVQFVHKQVLAKEHRDKNKDGKIAVTELAKIDAYVIRLLQIQKVIFLHEHEPDGVHRYIIPNFLPLAKEDHDFDLLTFGVHTPCFVLRFEQFIPFGLINEMICFFGQLPEKKRFWRDQLLFTHAGSLILIQLDFEQLEIRVHANTPLNDASVRFLFESIMSLYWGEAPHAPSLQTMEVRTDPPGDTEGQEQPQSPAPEKTGSHAALRCPADLYISLDDKHFMPYRHIEEAGEQDMEAMACIKDENGFHSDKWRIVSLYPFRPFTHKPFQKMKKIFISYSRKDTSFKDELKTHLSLYTRYGAITEWDCDQMLTGEWEAQIQTQLKEADIIIYVISANFMSSAYIMEEEVKKGIALVESDPLKSKKIMCVLARECPWRHWSALEKIAKEEMDITRYQILPYHPNKDDKGTIVSREILALEQWGRLHYEMPSVAYKDIAEKIFNEAK